MKFVLGFLLFLAVYAIRGEGAEYSPIDAPQKQLDIADNYVTKGEKLLLYAKFDSADFAYQQALKIYAAAVTSDSTLWEKVAGCKLALGEIQRQKTEFDAAKSLFLEGLTIAQTYYSETNTIVAECCQHLAMLYDNLADFKRSRFYVEKALAIRRKLYGEKHLDIAESMTLLGRLERYDGSIDSGNKMILDAHKMRLELADENNIVMAGSYLSLCWREDMEAYREYGLKALAVCSKLVGEMHPYVISANNTQAVYYMSQGDFVEARDILLKNDRLITAVYGHNAFQLIANNTNLAATFSLLKDFDRSIDYHKKVQRLLLARYGENIWYANSLNYLGQVYSMKGDYRMALEYDDRALALNIKLGVPIPSQLLMIYDNEAAIYLLLHESDKSLNFTQKILSFACPAFRESDIRGFPPTKELIADENVINAFNYRGQIFREHFYAQSKDEQDLELSLKNFQTALDILDRLYQESIADLSKVLLGDNVNQVCRNALETARLLYELNPAPPQQEMLHYFMDKEKSMVLSQAIQDAEAKQAAGIPDDLLQSIRSSRDRLAQSKTDMLVEAAKMSDLDSLKLIDLQNSYFTASRDFADLTAQLEKQYPRYYSLKYQIKVPTIAQIQSRLNERTALMEYFVSDSSLYSACITRGDCNIASVFIDSTFASRCDQFLAAIKADRRQLIAEIGYELYEKLVKPHEEKLADKTHLIVIPHSCLARIPFEALPTVPLSYRMVERFAVSYHYSAGLYIVSLDRSDSRIAADARKTFVGFAPVFRKDQDGNRITQKGIFNSYLASFGNYYSLITRDGEHFSELPYSRREIKRIADELRKHNFNTINLFDHDATEEAFKQDVQHADFVHLATHSFINEKEPILSGIAFYQTAGTVPTNDGVLYAEEIYSLNLDADLVVLSSCESGIGKVLKGEGMMGFTRGLLYAGACNILVSLWKVDDQLTSELMVAFYRGVLNGKIYAEALQEAKTSLLKKHKNLSPVHWSGFILIGQ